MKNGIQFRILISSIALVLAVQGVYSRDFKIGYGLDFSINELRASKIDTGFTDIARGGHTSFFFIETPIIANLLLQMSPGAMNFEDNGSQFHVQYNILGLNYLIGNSFLLMIGTGIGGSIATLSKGTGDFGEVQTGLFIKNTTLIWMAKFGAGYRFGDAIELMLEGKGIGFIDGILSNLNSFNIGATISKRIK